MVGNDSNASDILGSILLSAHEMNSATISSSVQIEPMKDGLHGQWFLDKKVIIPTMKMWIVSISAIFMRVVCKVLFISGRKINCGGYMEK